MCMDVRSHVYPSGYPSGTPFPGDTAEIVNNMEDHRPSSEKLHHLSQKIYNFIFSAWLFSV